MRVPAVCNNCGTIFPSGFEVSNSTNISFSGCGAGPCPKCGGNGHIPDGVYDFVGNTIKLLKGTTRTVSELQRLSLILKNARNEHSTLDEVKERISNEVPSLSSIRDILPTSRTELYAFITIIISIISLIIAEAKGGDTQHVEINQVFNTVYQQQVATVAPQYQAKSNKVLTPKRNKIGRNDRCPCGSGLKYKKCCLKNN